MFEATDHLSLRVGDTESCCLPLKKKRFCIIRSVKIFLAWTGLSTQIWHEKRKLEVIFIFVFCSRLKKQTKKRARERETEMWAPACWIPIMMMSANCTQPQLVWDTEMRCWCVKSHCCPGNNFVFNAFITKNLTVLGGGGGDIQLKPTKLMRMYKSLK